jgi:hypothetical protein
MTKTKILYLSSSPSDLDKLESDKEFRAIHENINDEFFKIKSVSNTQISDIQAVIFESQPDIIHFSGHGSSEDIILANDRNVSAGVFKPAFIKTFQNLKKKPELVFLNACQTYHNLADLSYIVDFVIATDRKVSDPSAIMFARNFYRFLSLGASITSSFNLARNQFDIESLIIEAGSPAREAVFEGDQFNLDSLANEAKMYRLLVREGASNHKIFVKGHRDLDDRPEPSRQKARKITKPESENKILRFIKNYNNRIGNQTNYQTGDYTTIIHNQTK